MISNWQPPFFLYGAGRDKINSPAYRNEPQDLIPRRLLIKHTLSGCGTIYIKNRRQALHSGDIFMIERTGPYVYCYEGDGEPWEFEFVSIGFDSPANILPEELRNNPVFSITDQPELGGLLKELIATRLVDDYRPNLMHSALAYSFFLAWVNIRLLNSNPIPAKVEQLRELLDAGVKQNLTIAEYCRTLGYSTEGLTRQFSAAYDISPGKYLQLVRLRLACELLRRNKKSIKEIAFDCGFGSQNYFGRLFQRTIGVTPGTYRKNPDPLLAEMLYLH
jgi:AraC-like DNA-binding protein